MMRSAICLLLAARASSYYTFQQKIPNGASVKFKGEAWMGVGHLAKEGGGARNPFGLAFKAAGLEWTADLCAADSDGDGVTNGAELGDPNCAWKEGVESELGDVTGHPGFADAPVAKEAKADADATPKADADADSTRKADADVDSTPKADADADTDATAKVAGETTAAPNVAGETTAPPKVAGETTAAPKVADPKAAVASGAVQMFVAPTALGLMLIGALM